MVKNYSLRKDGAKYLSDNFKVCEFRSKDGVDTVLVDESLVELLQAIRDRFGKPVIINSGYRTPRTTKGSAVRARATTPRAWRPTFIFRGCAR